MGEILLMSTLFNATFNQTDDLVSDHYQNFGNFLWEKQPSQENATKYSNFLKILRKDNMNPMKLMNPQNPKIKLCTNT